MKHRSHRITLGFAAGALLLWRAQPTLLTFLAGIVLMTAGATVRFLSAGTLVKFEGVTDTGIYAHTRNPLYAGSFLIGLGACIMGGDPLFLGAFLVVFPLYYWRVIRREERYLDRRYGDAYQRYVAAVPRIVPRRFDLHTVFEHSAPFLAVKNRELKTVWGILAVWALLAVKMAIMN